HGFTTAEVADEAGVSRGILHYHFDSKEEIIREALLLLMVEFGQRATQSVAVATGVSRSRLHALVDAPINEREVDFYATMLEFWSPARRDEAHRTIIAKLYDGWIVFIASIIEHGVVCGELPDLRARPRDLACALVALEDGLLVQHLIRRDWMPVARARAIAHA